MSAVETNNLVKAYGRKKVIDELTVSFGKNKITGLIGRNGAGKTTLLKLIAGYYKPTNGEILVFGNKPFNSLDTSSNMIFVDDSMAFHQILNLGDILREMQGFYPNFETALAQQLLDYFQINQKVRPSKLSKGMRSTFNSVIGIAARAPLTILDEPTTGMDAAVRKDFYRMLLKEYIAFPRTVILSSHLLGELTDLLEDIVLIDNGRLVACFSTDDAGAHAVGLRGSTTTLAEIVGTAPILHRNGFAPGLEYIVAKAPLPAEAIMKAQALGVEMLPVSADDLCIYLTQRGNGGIDDALRHA